MSACTADPMHGITLAMNEKIEALISPTKDVPPQLPRIISLRHVTLNRKFVNGECTEPLGFILRGTTTEFPDNNKIYKCVVDSVAEGGLADVSVSVCLDVRMFQRLRLFLHYYNILFNYHQFGNNVLIEVVGAIVLFMIPPCLLLDYGLTQLAMYSTLRG